MESSAPPNSSSAASLTHSAIQRLSGQSANCKVTSAILSGAALLFAAGRTGGEGLLWAAAPIGLLALADAGYVAKIRRLARLSGQYDGTKTPKAGDVIQNEVGEGGVKEAVQSLSGLLSFSVWPYYASMALLVGGLGNSVLAPKTPAVYSPTQPFAGVPGMVQPHAGTTPGGQPFPQSAPRPYNVPAAGQPGAPGGNGSAPAPSVAFPQAPGRAINKFPTPSGGQGAPSSTAPLNRPSSQGTPIGPKFSPLVPAPAPSSSPSASAPAPKPVTPAPAPTSK